MSFEARILKSYDGRRFGLQIPSSVESGSTYPQHYLCGPEAIRQNVTSAETTLLNLKAFGVSNLSTGSSAVHTLDPPIPGVEKTIVCTGGATEWVKTRNSETLESSRGSTFTTMTFNAYGIAKLLGLTTARWLMLAGDSSGTSSQSPSLVLSTTT